MTHLYINSKHRARGTPYAFRIDGLSTFQTDRYKIHLESVRFNSCIKPISVARRTNRLKFEMESDKGNIRTAIIPDGFYDIPSLINALTESLNEATPVPYNFRVEYDEMSGFLTIDSKEAFMLDLTKRSSGFLCDVLGYSAEVTGYELAHTVATV